MKKVISLITSFAMVMTMFAGIGSVNAEEEVTGSLYRNVEYDIIEFGSYPQTEIVYDKKTCGTYGKTFEEESDCIEDGNLYTRLYNAEYDENGDTTIDNVKYKRIKESDATYSSKWDNLYNWEDETTYHYFRYEPIKWRVLYSDGDDAFLLADVGLDCQRYNKEQGDITWENCTLRAWLNDSFLNSAFTKAEKKAINEVTLKNEDSSQYGTSGGNDTTDKIFLLSESEVCGSESLKYGFIYDNSQRNGRDKARRAKASTYAKAMGASTEYVVNEGYLGNCEWWLRSPGQEGLFVETVNYVGILSGTESIDPNRAVRPALHLNLKSSGVYNEAGSTGEISTLKVTDIQMSRNSYILKEGKAEPAVSISGLTCGEDYEVSYTDNDKIGTATVTVKGKGKWSGSISRNFEVVESFDISEMEIEILDEDIVYRGEECCPEIKVGDLVKDTDYTVTYENNDAPGLGKVIATGISSNGCTGSITKTFYIEDGAISGKTISIEDSSYTYTGNEIEPEVTVEGLSEGIDYTVEYEDNVDVGTGKVTITGKGKYTGTATRTFTIDPLNVASKELSLSCDEYVYDGSKKEPKVTLESLTEGTDYTVEYENNVNAGTGIVKVTGIGNCYGNISKTFTIERYTVMSKQVSLSCNEYIYDGSEKEPKVTIEGLTEGTDYTVEYENNVNAGTATVNITGIGNFNESKTLNFTISQADISEEEISLSALEYTYDGSVKDPDVKIAGLTKEKDYYISEYEDNVNAGTGKVIITGTGNYTGTVTRTFTINPADIAEKEINLSYDGPLYDGTPQTPNVMIDLLIEGIDYTVEYEDNIDAGTAKVIITGIGNYTGTAIKTFTIRCFMVGLKPVLLSCSEYVYDGSEKKPEVTLEGLTEGIDFTVEYKDNVNVGIAEVTVTGIGNCDETTFERFTIVPADISEKEISLSSTEYMCDGNEKEPEVEIEGLTEGEDYTVEYKDNINAGEGKVIVTGKGNYTGTATVEFTINPSSFSGKSMTLSASLYTYDGSEKKPEVTIEGLTLGEDYTVEYQNNVNAGRAMVIVKGGTNYPGTATIVFTIKPAEISLKSMTLSADSYTYDGKEKNPEVKITGLTESKDYTLKYRNNIDAGKASVEITGKGNYTGTVTKAFDIEKADISEKSIKLSGYLFTYSGKNIKPSVSVTGLEKGTDYTVSYSSNVKCGKAKVSIDGTGNYSGSVAKYFKIKPAKAAVSKTVSGKKYITVKIKSQKSSGVTGYQVSYKQVGASAKTVMTSSTSKKIKGLKSGKKYTVKVRAYKTIGGKKVYGAYSASKTVKVK